MTTIADVLDTFLAEQEARLSERIYRRYDEVIWLFRDCMNGYGHSSLSELERKRFEAAYDDDPEAYVHLFGPDKIPDEYWLEDMFVIERVEPGKLWFVGHPDPVIVPAKASAIAQEGWDITGTIARLDGRWRFVEVGNVYP